MSCSHSFQPPGGLASLAKGVFDTPSSEAELEVSDCHLLDLKPHRVPVGSRTLLPFAFLLGINIPVAMETLLSLQWLEALQSHLD